MIPSLQILDGADVNGEDVDDSLDGEVLSHFLYLVYGPLYMLQYRVLSEVWFFVFTKGPSAFCASVFLTRTCSQAVSFRMALREKTVETNPVPISMALDSATWTTAN